MDTDDIKRELESQREEIQGMIDSLENARDYITDAIDALS